MKHLCRSNVCAIAVLCLWAPAALAVQMASETRVIPQLVDGGLTRSLIVVTNTSDTLSAAYQVNFYGDDGMALSFPIIGLGSTDHLAGNLAPGASVFVATPGTASVQQQGWAALESSTSDSVALSQILQIKDLFSGRFSSETLVQGTEEFFGGSLVMPFDNTGGNVSSMALASTYYLSDEAIDVTAIDQDGNILKRDTVAIQALHHLSFILAKKWPELNNVQGTLIFKPLDVVANVSIMGLRFASIEAGFTVATLPLMQHY